MSVFLTKGDYNKMEKEIEKYFINPFLHQNTRKREIINYYKTHNMKIELRKYLPDKINIPIQELEKIAVIGNGSCIRSQGLGKEIDSHTMVIRINDYIIDNRYYQDIGKKTHLYLMNVYSMIANLFDNKFDGKAKYLLFINPHQKNYGFLLIFYCYLHHINHKYKNKIYVLSLGFRRKICSVLKYEHPSSGFFGSIIAKNLNSKSKSKKAHVSLFGFNIEDKTRTHYQHYPKKLLDFSFHKIIKEYTLYSRWECNEFRIRLRKTNVPKGSKKIKRIIEKKIVIPKKEIKQIIEKKIIIPKKEIKQNIIPKKEIKTIQKEILLKKELPDVPPQPTFLSKNKIALYIYGKPYRFKQNIPYLKSFIKNLNIDIFIHFNNINLLTNDIKYIVDNIKPVRHKFLLENKKYKLIDEWKKRELLNNKIINKTSEIECFMNFEGLHECNRMRIHYEKQTKNKYDTIVSTKLDICYMTTLNNILGKINDIEYNTVYIPKYNHGFGINSNFALGTPETMNIYSTIYTWLSFAKDIYILKQNYLLCKYLLLKALKINTINLDYIKINKKRFSAYQQAINDEQYKMKNNWDQLGDLKYLETNKKYITDFLKIKLNSINNIYNIDLYTKPVYYIYNPFYKKYLKIESENDLLFGCSTSGLPFILTLPKNNNRTRICMKYKINNQYFYMNFSEKSEVLTGGVHNELSELYLIKHEKYYSFQIIHRQSNKQKTYGKHIHMDRFGIISCDHEINKGSQFLLINENLYNLNNH